MAKADNANLFEKHVEKGALAILVLFLIYAVVHWGISSPRSVVVENDAVSPEESAKAVAELAARVDRLNERAGESPQTPGQGKLPIVPEEYLPEPDLVSLTPPRPVEKGSDFTPEPVSVSLAGLALVTPGPTKPDVAIYPELPDVPAPGPGRRKTPVDTNVARAIALFPIEQIRRAWDEKVQSKFAVKVLVLRVEVERRTGDADSDWEKIPAESLKLAAAPMFVRGGRRRQSVEFVRVPEIPPYDRTNAARIGQLLGEIEQLQEALFQPDYWKILSDDQWGDWRQHLPQEPLKKLDADIQAKWGEDYEQRAASRGDRRTRGTRKRRPAGLGRGGVPREDLRLRTGMRPGGILDDDFGIPGERPDRRMTGRRRIGRGARGTAVGVDSVLVPSLDAQLLYGHVLIWIHDLSVRPGQWYQYRIRLKLHNPLHMNENYLERKNRGDAKKAEIFTQWSPWSDPQGTPPATEFFLTGVSKSNVTIMAFARALGTRQRHEFLVAKGQIIGGGQEKAVANPYYANEPGQDQFRNVRVDFGTGATLIDIRSRTFPGATGRDTTSSEILYLDRTQRLRTAPVAKKTLEPELFSRLESLRTGSSSGER